ncbi:MAG: L,D-transpeptidase [Alphaproteobacteria bacterium]|nr:L,D-transpeptidase [Alphaproteobacteria bacterium]
MKSLLLSLTAALWAVCVPPAFAAGLDAAGDTLSGTRPAGIDSVGAQIERDVESRLRDSLSPEMLQNFGLFIYVSKAAAGPWAQRMLVYQKVGEDLLLLYDWPVSTGRETVEASPSGTQLPTNTPAGYYEFDPKRFYTAYRSTQWDEDMPFAMFFNWIDHGSSTGLAIHGTSPEGESLLGMRASAGCVRLSKDNARTLFAIVRDNFKGMAPKFAFDKHSGTLMNNGLLAHDPEGNLVRDAGYSVLIFVDDFGGQNLEAQAY